MSTALVSVVIPLYNAEKYLAECFESLLAQTFRDFEVIIVDDCSTDNSLKIVEHYIPKFGGRLTFSRMEKNSGSGALPRNKGLKLSRGEYVFFMDADDLIIPTALEELYMLAKNYDPDFIYIEKHYEANDDLSKIILRGRQSGGFVDKPTFESENLNERLQSLLNKKFGVTPWLKFLKRDWLIENELFFPHVKIGEDDLWTYALIFYAKKLLRVPNAVYVQRLSTDSITRIKRTAPQQMCFWINPLILGLKHLDSLLSRQEFFKQNPQSLHLLLNIFVNAVFDNVLTRSAPLSVFDFYTAIKKEFGAHLGEQDVLVSALCSYINDLQKNHAADIRKFNQFAAQAQQRINQLENELNKKI